MKIEHFIFPFQVKVHGWEIIIIYYLYHIDTLSLSNWLLIKTMTIKRKEKKN